MELECRIKELEEKIEGQLDTILEKAGEIEYLNHQLEESEQARRDLEKKLEGQKRELWEYQDLEEYLRDRLKESERERGVLVERIKELSTEYIVLYEGQRWRKQDLEPAPKGMKVLTCKTKSGYLGYVDGGAVRAHTYWRPFELPENKNI